MARPTSPDYEKRKKLILDNAAKVFANSGYHKASIDQIADACTMSKSLIYHYYKSKQDILFHCMEEHVTTLYEEAQRCQKLEVPTEEKLKTLLQTFMQFYQNAGPRHRILVNDLIHLKDDQREQIVATENLIVGIFKSLIEEVLKHQPKDSTHYKVLSLLLMSMINWTYTWFNPDGPIKPEELGTLVADIFLHGILDKKAE